MPARLLPISRRQFLAGSAAAMALGQLQLPAGELQSRCPLDPGHESRPSSNTGKTRLELK